MAAPETHTQCKLRRLDTVQVTWLPTKFARKGHFVKLKSDDGTWEDGWEVVETWGAPRSSAYVAEHERDYLKQREASDI